MRISDWSSDVCSSDLDFFFMMARDWQLAKAAFGNQTQFVVVVENHPAAARDAKVFQQQITREQIAARQILDRLAIIELHPFGLARRYFVDVHTRKRVVEGKR